MIKFNHKDDSYFGALGVSIKRFEEIQDIFKKNITSVSRIGTKSMGVEKLLELINPKNASEIFVIGILMGGYDAHAVMYRKMVDDMRDKFKIKGDNIDDF